MRVDIIKYLWSIWLLCIGNILLGQSVASLPIKGWIDNIEKSSQYLFNYDPSILSSKPIAVPTSIHSPKELLNYISKITKYKFSFIDDKYIMIRAANHDAFYNETNIKCSVRDATTGEPLAFANVYTEDFSAGCTSLADGTFVLKGHFNPHQFITISYLGYEDTKVHLTDIMVGNVKYIQLKPIDQFLDDVVITDNRNAISERKIEQSTVIKTPNLPLLAGLAEKDPLSMVQLLPGVSAIGESVSNISFRGSTSDQNLVTWNQIPLYHTGHFVGLLSSCNPYVIDEITVYNDGFRSNFGGRIAGVINMDGKKHHPNKHIFNANINLLTANIHALVPIVKDRISIEASYRTSYGDVFNNVIYKSFFNQAFQFGRISNINNFIETNELQGQVFNKSKVDFYDYNLRALFTPTPKDKIEINYIKAQDLVSNSLTFDWSEKHETDTISLGNFGLSSIWSHQFSDRYTTQIAYIYSGFDNGYRYYEDITFTTANGYISKNNGVKETKITWDHALTFGDINLAFGYHRNNITNLNKRVSIPNNIYEPDEDITNIGVLDALYFNYQYQIQDKFNLDIGARYSKYNLTGQYFTEPRLTLWQQLNEQWRIKASAGKYTQVLTQIEEYNDVQVEEMYWRLADGKVGNELIPITTNTQYSTGVSYQKNGWKADLVLYSKNVENITALGLEFDSGLNPWWIATGKSIGAEFSLSKKWLFGSSNINYSHNDMTLDFGDNRVYPAPYNHRHQFMMMQTYQNKKWELSLIYKIKSGRPYSEYTSFYVGEPNEFGDPEAIFVYDKQFDRFLPTYHRVDFSGAYQFISKPKNKWSARIGISILNLLNQHNIMLRSNYVDYAEWPTIKPATFDRVGLGITPNVFMDFRF